MFNKLVIRLKVFKIILRSTAHIVKAVEDAQRYQILRQVGVCTDPFPETKVIRIGPHYFTVPGVQKIIVSGCGDGLDHQLDRVIRMRQHSGD